MGIENRTIPSPPARMEAGVKSAAKQLGFSARDGSRLDTLHEGISTIRISLSMPYRRTKSILRPIPAYDIGATPLLIIRHIGAAVTEKYLVYPTTLSYNKPDISIQDSALGLLSSPCGLTQLLVEDKSGSGCTTT